MKEPEQNYMAAKFRSPIVIRLGFVADSFLNLVTF